MKVIAPGQGAPLRGVLRPRRDAGARRRGRPVRRRRYGELAPVAARARCAPRSATRRRPDARRELAPPGRREARPRLERRRARRDARRARGGAGPRPADAARSPKAIFLEARRAHAEAQGGGSGVDIAASTYGGALFYGMIPADDPLIETVDLPAASSLRVFWSGRSARTSELLAKVRRFAEKDRRAFARCIDAHRRLRDPGRLACDAGDAPARERGPDRTRGARGPRSTRRTRRSSRRLSPTSPSLQNGREGRSIRRAPAAATWASG